MSQKGCKRGEEGLVLCVEYSGNEILSGFVVTAGMTTKPDSGGSFARQIGWEECAPQCAFMVRRRVRAREGREERSPSPSCGTIPRAVTR